MANFVDDDKYLAWILIAYYNIKISGDHIEWENQNYNMMVLNNHQIFQTVPAYHI